MKVLHVINNLDTGGAERLIVDLLVQLQEVSGIKVDLLLLEKKKTPLFEELKANFRGKILTFNNSKLYNPLILFKLSRIILHYDIVHAHLFPSLYWVALTKFFFNIKTNLFFTEHSTRNNRINNFFFRFFDKFIYAIYDFIYAITPSVKEVLMKELNIRQEKIKVVYNGIDLDKYKKAKSIKKHNLNIPEDSTVLMQISRFSKAKDQITTIQSLFFLPSSYILVLVGDGILLQKTMLYVKKNKLNDRVFFLGNRTDIPELLKTADIIIQSSHWEGFGLAAVEGMAAGKPVIASNVTGLAEVVKDSGILFEKGNSKELASIVKCLIDDKKYYATIGRLCSIKAESYSLNLMVKKYVDLYKSQFYNT